MKSIAYLKLRAIHPEKNIIREYSLNISEDLFGYWLLQSTFGHIGSRGKTRTYAFKDYHLSFRKMMSLLNKRLKSRKKTGYPYQIVDSDIDAAAIW